MTSSMLILKHYITLYLNSFFLNRYNICTTTRISLDQLLNVSVRQTLTLYMLLILLLKKGFKLDDSLYHRKKVWQFWRELGCESPSKPEACNAREMIVKPLWNVREMPARRLRQEESEKVEHQMTERGQGVGLKTGEDCWFRGQELLTTYYRKC